jgi:glycosyltransferase involved in cell wall biosynthesis
MHVWLIQPGEPLPCDTDAPRMLRTGMLGAQLLRRGHRVTWWATTFRHATKIQRAPANVTIEVSPGYELKLLRSPGYGSNISLRRLVDHRILGRRFREQARLERPPDVIHCSFPTIELAYECARYARSHDVPWVIDARDMWPDIYVDSAPKALRPLVRIALSADFRMTREAFRSATAVSGHAPAFVEWGLRKAGRAGTARDRDFPFSYAAEPPSERALSVANDYWRAQGIAPDDQRFIVCFFGTFAERREVDIETVIRAARLLQAQRPNVKIVLCGAGPASKHYEAMARDLPNVVMPGWVDAAQIWTLMRLSHVGLLPYLPSPDFAASIPNKAIEYLSAGLPVLTCLRGGYLDSVLREARCGVLYEEQSAESLSAAIAGIQSDPAALERQRSAAHALFESRFRHDAVFGQMIDHLELLARRG